MALNEVAYFGGGCFWCTEAVFLRVRGVKDVMPGYAGGDVPDPTYEEVSSGLSGHAEVVKVTFDPSVVTYAQLLDIFWAVHDPTTLNRQGADVGSQYRSIILTTTPEQRAEAKQAVQLMKEAGIEAVTEIQPFETFYPAEEHHLRYYERNAAAPYCRLVIEPKLRKLLLNKRKLTTTQS